MPRSRGVRAWFSRGRALLPAAVLCAAGLWSYWPNLDAAAAPDPSSTTLSPQSSVIELLAPGPSRSFFPRGKFGMGSSPEEILRAYTHCTTEVLGHLCDAKLFQDEGPRRRVRLSAFTLDRYEVTVAQYQRCVDARRCDPIPYYKGGQRFSQPQFPASLITWDEARSYCAFVDARLPTEAEWERAARGQSRRVYPWGNLYNARVSNHGRLAHDPTDDTDGFVELAPVGSFPAGATPELVFDLGGNVEEWTFDRYAEEYDRSDTVDPIGPSSGTDEPLRSVRGGHFMSPPVQLRGAARAFAPRGDRNAGRGFRCARSAAAI